jgi:glutathione S-transferase
MALLEIAGIPNRKEIVDLDAGAHMSAGFLVINPNHQVPVLDDDGFVLTESNAILRYLCGKHSLTDWYPPETETRAQVDTWLDWNQCRLAQPVIDVVVNSLFLGENGDADAIERGKAALVETGAILATHLRKTPYLAGSKPTIADLSVASNITQLGLADAIPDHEEIRDWYARVCEIEGFRKTLPPPLADAA